MNINFATRAADFRRVDTGESDPVAGDLDRVSVNDGGGAGDFELTASRWRLRGGGYVSSVVFLGAGAKHREHQHENGAEPSGRRFPQHVHFRTLHPPGRASPRTITRNVAQSLI